MPRTPDRSPGVLEEDEEIQLGANPGAPAVAGGLRYDGTDFQFRDAAGTFNPRSGGGISEPQHEALDTLAHNLSETHEQVPTFNADGIIVTLVAQGVGGGTVIQNADLLTADANGLVTGYRLRQRDAAGAVVQTLTGVVSIASAIPTKNTVTKT